MRSERYVDPSVNRLDELALTYQERVSARSSINPGRNGGLSVGGNMFLNSKHIMFAVLCCAGIASSLAMAQNVPDHPRVNEVNQRLDDQQARINQGLANGTMTGNQAARDDSHDANIARRESVDEAAHGGHLTKGEQNRLNRSLNRNSRHIYAQKH